MSRPVIGAVSWAVSGLVNCTVPPGAGAPLRARRTARRRGCPGGAAEARAEPGSPERSRPGVPERSRRGRSIACGGWRPSPTAPGGRRRRRPDPAVPSLVRRRRGRPACCSPTPWWWRPPRPTAARTHGWCCSAGVDDDGFRFFSNFESVKGHELAGNAACGVPLPLARCCNVRCAPGAGRARARRRFRCLLARPSTGEPHQCVGVGAERSRSARVPSSTRVATQAARRFGDGEVPRPPFWGGYRVVVDELELWQHRDDRFHDRLRYSRSRTLGGASSGSSPDETIRRVTPVAAAEADGSAVGHGNLDDLFGRRARAPSRSPRAP